MNKSQEKIRQIESQQQNVDVNSTENEDTELISGKVSEFARDNISENASEDAKTSQTAKKSDEEVKQDKVDLREKLLEKAPSEKIMIAQIKVELTKERKKLEKQVGKLKYSKKYDLFEDALRALRAIVRQIEELAEIGLEAIKDLWLKVVLKFS